jgi:hypothetical protein
MARLVTCGFENNSTTLEGFTISGSAASITSGTVRSGTYGLKVLCSTSQGYAIFHNYGTPSGKTLSIRAYVYITTTLASSKSLLTLADYYYYGRVFIKLTTSRTLQLWSTDSVNETTTTQIGSDSSALSTGQWYRIELTFVQSSEVATAYIDGSSFATGTTNITATPDFGDTIDVGIGGYKDTGNIASGEIEIDDFAFNDSSGTSQNGLPGSGKIITLRPSATGDSNGFLVNVGGTAGVANNFTRVDEVTPDDATTYNASVVLNAVDLFACNASGIGASDTVNVVVVGGRYANIIADATSAFKYEIEKTTGGTKSLSSAIIPNSVTWKTTTNATSKAITLYKDPDNTNAWTQATLDTMQIGYTITTANVNTIAISTIWALVDYTPAGAAPTTHPFRSLLGVGI